jgi:tetratricopeptide (TPR) repeat protein
VTRVFPVADLAIPIPNSVNQRTLFQNQAFQNQTLAIFGQASLFGGGLQNLGGFGGFGGGGGVGIGGNLGQGGGNIQGQAVFGGAAQVLGVQANLGSGGGFTSFGGGNLGQFGNLGGQFGIQGGDQSQLLMRLIFETVAKGEWANLPNTRPMPGMGDEDVPLIPANQLNSLGYYPPARALIVRGTTRYHPAASLKLMKQDGMARGPGGNPGGGQVVIGPGGEKKEPVVAPRPEGIKNPKVDAAAMRKEIGTDPKKMWNEAIARTITDPGIILASAEFLMEMDCFSDAAEVLKGNLRKGLATDAWAHEALAVALQAGGANPAEVERAAVSAIDLDPASAKAYLKAAKVEADLKNHSQAFAFCKRASECSPNDPTPYANALAYAEFASDVKSDAVMWAADNLLKRDWSSTDGIDYHREVKDRLPKLEAKLRAAGQDAAVLSKAIADESRRDLVIELLWQGNADLDLVVFEPSGSTCSATHKRTTGGGVLKADILEQRNDRSEVYTASSAFGGTYKVSAKQAFGRSIGGKATLRVTKFKGTPQERTDLLDVTPGGRPVEIALEGGSRTALADVSEAVTSLDLRAQSTGAALTSGVSGLGGGFSTAGGAMASPVATSGGPALPLVTPPSEERLPGISAAAADIRATYKLNPDRKTFSVTVNPVFAGKGEIAMPKVPLLPGGEGK